MGGGGEAETRRFDYRSPWLLGIASIFCAFFFIGPWVPGLTTAPPSLGFKFLMSGFAATCYLLVYTQMTNAYVEIQADRIVTVNGFGRVREVPFSDLEDRRFSMNRSYGIPSKTCGTIWISSQINDSSELWRILRDRTGMELK
jgi:hypothetical protein